MAWRSRIEYLPFNNQLKFYIANEGEDRRNIVRSFEFADISMYESAKDDDVLTVDERMLQSMMDAMWKHGLRPTNGPSDKQELDAVKSHLNDMKEIAYHVLKVGK